MKYPNHKNYKSSNTSKISRFEVRLQCVKHAIDMMIDTDTIDDILGNAEKIYQFVNKFDKKSTHRREGNYNQRYDSDELAVQRGYAEQQDLTDDD